MYRKQQHKKRRKEGKKEKVLSRTRAALTELLTVKRKTKNNANVFRGNEWMKEHNYALQNAYTRPRLQSRTQNICLVISISAVILKLMVKITYIFGSYRFLRIAWHEIVSLSHHLNSSKYLPCCGVEEQMLIFSSSLTPGRVKGSWNPIPKLTIVFIWNTPACPKFGKISNRALSQRKLWVWTANPNFVPRVFIKVFRGAMHCGKKWRGELWLNAMHVKKRWVREFVPPYIFRLHPDYVAARSLRSLRSN